MSIETLISGLPKIQDMEFPVKDFTDVPFHPEIDLTEERKTAILRSIQRIPEIHDGNYWSHVTLIAANMLFPKDQNLQAINAKIIPQHERWMTINSSLFLQASFKISTKRSSHVKRFTPQAIKKIEKETEDEINYDQKNGIRFPIFDKLDTPLFLKIIYPNRKIEFLSQYFLNMERKDLPNILPKNNIMNWIYLMNAASYKILYPKEFAKAYSLDANFWLQHRMFLKQIETEKESPGEELGSRMFSLAILAAKEVNITNQGISLVFGKRQGNTKIIPSPIERSIV